MKTLIDVYYEAYNKHDKGSIIEGSTCHEMGLMAVAERCAMIAERRARQYEASREKQTDPDLKQLALTAECEAEQIRDEILSLIGQPLDLSRAFDYSDEKLRGTVGGTEQAVSSEKTLTA